MIGIDGIFYNFLVPQPSENGYNVQRFIEKKRKTFQIKMMRIFMEERIYKFHFISRKLKSFFINNFHRRFKTKTKTKS